MQYVDFLFDIANEYGITPEETGAHAGEYETTLILALEGDLVRRDRFAPGHLGYFGENEVKIILEKGMPALTEKGVLGDPTKASAEGGEVYLEKVVDFLVKEIRKQLQ